MTDKISLRIDTGRLSKQLDQRRYSARFVRAGQVRAAGNHASNITIEPQALTDAWERGLFNAKPVFVDHASFWEYPSLNNLVGVSQHANWNEAEGAVEGQIRLYNTPLADRIAELIDQILVEDTPPDIGLSLVFYPIWETGTVQQSQSEASTLRRIVAIKHVESIDLVFEPAADGRILQALSAFRISKDEVGEGLVGEGLRPSPTTGPTLTTGPTPGRPGIPMPDSPNAERNHLMSDPIPNQPNKGALTMSENPQPEAFPTSQGVPKNPVEEVETPEDRSGSWLSALERSTIEAMIKASGLPAASQERLLSQAVQAGSGAHPIYGAHPTYARPEDVQTAIENERAYLARLQEDRVVQIGGAPPRQPTISGMRTSLDQIQIALEALLEGVRPANSIQPLTGIRELYMLLSGDYELTGMFHPERVQFANVTTATMANITADVLNKRVMAEFGLYPRWWEPVVIIEDFASLQDVKWIVLGGIGELPTVAEGAAYTEMSWDDKKETSTFVKKGGYLGITLESIDKDDTARLRAAPRALAQAAWLTLSKSISSIFTSNSGAGPTLTDGTVLFHSSRGNIGTSALSIASWEAARTAMRKMTELNSGERLGALTVPRYLLVPPDLEITALQVLASEYDYEYALSNGTSSPANVSSEGDSFNQRLQFARDRVVVVDLWTDTNNWYACADPRLYPTIGLGFRYGRTPEVFSVASPTAGLMFTNDTMPVKVRFFYATGPIDHRGLYAAVVA